MGSALSFPVSNLSLKWLRLSEFMVYLCHWYMGVCLSVYLSVVPQQFDVISHNVPLLAHENSVDLEDGLTD